MAADPEQWYLDNHNNEYEVINGVLHIRKGTSGDGVMGNFTSTSTVKQVVHEEVYTSVVIESGMTTIGNYAFYNDGNIIDVDIADTVTSINGSAFRGCSSLALTSLPSGIISLGGNVFYGCTALALTSLPSGITSINSSAFRECTHLALVSLPQGITTISNNAFQNCTSLALTSLPSSVTTIDNYAFSGCTLMTEITMENPVPCTIGTTPFPTTTTIYVPYGSGNAYKSAWTAYASKIVELSPPQYYKLTRGNDKIQVDSAIRDGTGKKIDTHYQKKLTAGAGINIINDVINSEVLIDDTSTTSLTDTWSASKLNSIIGDIEAVLDEIRGV